MRSARRSGRSVARILGAAAALVLPLGLWPTLVGAASSGGTTSLFIPQGSGQPTSSGDYVSAAGGGGLNTAYHYFVEVPQGISRLRVQLFDADIGVGTNWDAQRTGAWSTAARYTLIDPGGVTQATLTGDGAGPVGSDNAWITLGDTLTPQFRTATTATVNPAAANITLNVPPGTANNNLLIAVISRDNNATAIPTPNGWQLVNEGACGGNGTCELGVFWRLAASEPASYTFGLGATQAAVGTMLRYTGVDTTTPIDTNIAFATGNSAAPTAPTVNTTVANTRVVRAFVADNNNLAANPYPRDHTGRFALGTGTLVSGAAADELQGAAGAVGTAAFALSAGQRWRAVTLAIRPAATAPAPDDGHWEVQVDQSSAVTAGNDVNGFGLRADDGDATSGGTELNIYYDSQNSYGGNGGNDPDPRQYAEFPYVTSGCSCSSNDFDFDHAGSLTYRSRTGVLTRNFTAAQLSGATVWGQNGGGAPMTWTTDTASIDYGLWRLDVLVNQPNGANYALVWVGNFLAGGPTPPANPTANAFRVYLPTDGGAAPVKPYLEQQLTYVSGANPPAVGQTTTLAVTVRIVNPTPWPITFSGGNQVTANVPGPATYQGNAQVTAGTTITGQPGVGGTGNITWNPGTGSPAILAPGATAILSYRVAIVPTLALPRVPVTGVVSTGGGANGTRATFVDETGNTTQTRATYTLGPICELAATAGTLLTPAVVSSVRAHDSGRGVVVEWDTVSEVGTVGFDLLRWDPETSQYVTVNKKLLLGLVASPQGGRYRFVDEGASPFETHHYVLAEVEASGERRFHGPFEVKVDRISSTRSIAAADGYERASRPMSLALGRALQAHRAEAAMTAAVTAPRAGSAMKIGVDASGFYRVSAQAIATTLGLPLSRVQSLIATHQLALSTRGHAVAWMRALGDGILFYGQALDSIYTRDNVYWLRVGNGLTMALVNGGSPSPAGPGQSFVDVTHAEQDRLPATVVSNNPETDYWYWDYLSGGDATLGRKSFPVVASGVAAGGAPAGLRVRLQGATSTGVAGEHHVVIRLNGVVVGEAQWQGIAPETVDLSMSSGLVHEGGNTVELEALLDPGVPYSIVYVDSFDLSYPRRYLAVGGALAFRAESNAVVTVEGFSDGRIEVLDVSDPLRPRRVSRVTIGALPLGRFVASFIPSSPDAPYVAVTPQGWRSPRWVMADSPSRLKATNQGADYVILTTAEMLAPARRLAALREAQGLRSKVVDVVDVMDEFNDGVSSPHALQAFLDYARSRWSPAPRFVLLAGAGTLDYKDNMGLGGNLVPPLMAATPSGLFASDNLFVDFDGDHAPEMAIGRVPALTASELDVYVNRIQAFEASDGAGWKERALWVADDPDGAVDFGADATRLAASLPAGYAPEAIYLAPGTIAATRTQLLSGLAAGAGLLNYVGHGGLDRLAAEGLLVTADANSLGNGERLPVVTALTCIINRFEFPGLVPLGAALVKSPAGGAAAVWAPTGLSSNTEANGLGARFYQEMASAPGERLGEVVRRALGAHARVNPESSLVNVYNLLGDPALVLKPPEAAEPGGPDAFSTGPRSRD
jgi:hypothetical protein